MQGHGSAFRTPGWLERTAQRAGRLLPRSATRALRRTYEGLLTATSGDTLISRLPGGELVRVLPQHRQITWNPEEYAALRAEVAAGPPGSVAIDVGANVGAYSVLFGMWVGPAGRVFAFEPAPDAFRGLTGHIELNGLAARVFPQQLAVSNREGTASFVACGHDGSNRFAAGPGPAGAVEVTCTTLDAFCRANGIVPSVIKIDAEGAELDVLSGARETIRAAGRGLALFVEMHPQLWSALGLTRDDIEAELERQRLVPERLDKDPDVWGLEGVCLRLRSCAS